MKTKRNISIIFSLLLVFGISGMVSGQKSEVHIKVKKNGEVVKDTSFVAPENLSGEAIDAMISKITGDDKGETTIQKRVKVVKVGDSDSVVSEKSEEMESGEMKLAVVHSDKDLVALKGTEAKKWISDSAMVIVPGDDDATYIVVTGGNKNVKVLNTKVDTTGSDKDVKVIVLSDSNSGTKIAKKINEGGNNQQIEVEVTVKKEAEGKQESNKKKDTKRIKK